MCFQELLNVSKLHSTILLDVVVACCMFRNELLEQGLEGVERLLNLLDRDEMRPEVDDDLVVKPPPPGPPYMDHARGDQK